MIRFVLLTALVVLLTQTRAGFIFASASCGPEKFKIPEHIKPLHYELTIKPDSDAMTFDGSVKIRLQRNKTRGALRSLISGESSDEIILNADRKFIEINKRAMRFTRDNREKVDIIDFCYDEVFGNIVLTLDGSLEAGSTGVLHLDFVGKIQNVSTGFFRGDSTGADGLERSLLMTQLEPAKARQLFPCFDEPQFKATFQVTVVHPVHEIVLSNTAVESSAVYSEDPSKRLTRFAKTPPMSSYLLAIVVGQFDFVEAKLDDGRVTVRVYAPPGRAEEGRQSLNSAVEMIKWFEDYFGINYPLSKMDFVSTPKFAGAGMENFGLITFRESLLLFKKRTKKISIMIGYVTMAHELVHQWLGNMVTLSWWNETWLNEGIVTWLGYRVADELRPDLKIELMRKLEINPKSLSMDIARVIRPAQISSVQEAESVSDQDSYTKGAAISEMIFDYIGPAAFRLALSEFVQTNQYSSAHVANLIKLFEKHSDLPVAEFLNSWLDSRGHPLFEARYDSSRKNLIIAQRHYQLGNNKPSLWTTPMKILVSSGDGRQEIITTLMDDEELTVKLPKWFDSKKKGHFVKLNPEASGFYHVKYSEELLKHLISALEHNRLSFVDKHELLTSAEDLRTIGEVSAAQLDALESAML